MILIVTLFFAGPSILAGVGVLVLLVPVNSVIANKIKNFSASQIRLQDKRIKMLNEVISGIKVGWLFFFIHYL